MIGPYVNGAALLVGSTIGALLGPKLNHNLKMRMPMVFGCASMGLGVAMIVKVKFLAPVVLALVLGSILGELLQLETARKLDIREDIYFEIIRQKTASLIASACASGAATTTTDEEVLARVKKMGEKIGIAFQIKYDLFDYEDEEVGKPRGIDIKERKMTLPLIHALGKVSVSDRRKIINIVKNENTNMEKVRWVIDMVRSNGGMDYAKLKMNEYKTEAENILYSFPENDARKSIYEMIQFTINRSI